MVRNLPQYAAVETPFGAEPPILHCPLCGNATIDKEREDLTSSPCPHFAFLYLGTLGELIHQSSDFEHRLAATVENKGEEGDEPDFDCHDLTETLSRLGYGNEMLAIAITYGGMACGPVWYTDFYGFDLSAGLEAGTGESNAEAESEAQ